jgi:pimeloyl-ACP methyl ester carboxylesterase
MNTFDIEKNITGSAKESITILVEDNVRLNVIRFTPVKPESNVPVVMVTGLGTIIESFHKVISFLAQRTPLIFIETREKISSQIEGKTSFGIETQSLDLARIIDYLKLGANSYFLLGYSYGATIVAHSYSILRNKPAGIIFLEPTPVFHYPKWSLILIKYFGSRMYFLINPFAKWYLGHFYINKKEDNEMAVISSKTLDNSNPGKLRRAILDIAGYEVWNRLETIDCKTLVVGTSKDGLHNKKEVERMVQMLENAEYFDLETNQRTHSIEMGEIAYRFFQKIIERNKSTH